MGLRALLNVSKGQQEKLTPMQMRVKGAPRSMDDPKAKTAPTKEAIEEVLRQCESPLLAYAIKMVRDAEQMLELGNQKIAQGEQRQARRALESAYKLSQNDAAFNEDARVQLQKLKTQQAMMGINIIRNNFLINNGVVSQQIEQQQAAIPLQQGKGVN